MKLRIQFATVIEAMSAVNAKVVVVGDQAVGKTSTIRRFVDDSFKDNYLPTLGFEISVKTLPIQGQIMVFSIWDIAGQQCFDPMRLQYYAGGHGFLMMFNLAVRGTLKNLDNWIVDIQQTCPGAPIVIVGNKSDLPDRTVTDEDLEAKVAEFGAVGSILTSAKTGEGVVEAFALLGASILSKVDMGQ